MLAAGLVAEVRGVLARGVPGDAPGLDAVGYREVVAMLQGRLPERELRDAIVVATRRYAKRQDTWFRNQLRHQPSAVGHQLDAVWTLDATPAPEVLAQMILKRWHTGRTDD
jgi:tRNA A37 N6-isopentenylltransferase MiaA